MLLASIGIIIFSTIMIINCQETIKISELVDIDDSYIFKAKAGVAYGIGLIFFSLVIFIIGLYVTAAGIKSWKYKTQEE